MTLHLTIERILPAGEIAKLYPIYARAWDRLLIHAAARHVLSEAEFAEEMLDERIEKIMVRDDTGAFVGLTTLATDMGAIPWINPTHYAHRYPDAAARDAVFYLGYTFVDHQHRHHNLLKLMTEAIDQRASAAGAVVGFDICSFNVAHGLGRRLKSLVKSSDRIDLIDSQTYYAADYRKLEQSQPPPPSLTDSYDLMSLADRPELMDEVRQLMAARWPAYALHGRFGHGLDLEQLLLRTAEQQILLVDAYDALCGIGFSLPLWWDGSVEGLPDGRDDAIRQSADLVERGRPANSVCALIVTIASDASGYGLAGRVIGGMSQAANRIGAHTLLAPVRPLRKSSYPLTSMNEYVTWRNPLGETFDPSLRLHLRHGGKLLSVAEESVVVRGTVSQWESWLDLALPASGSYVFEGGLTPLVVDREANLATYREPNVWVSHAVPEPVEDWPELGDTTDAEIKAAIDFMLGTAGPALTRVGD